MDWAKGKGIWANRFCLFGGNTIYEQYKCYVKLMPDYVPLNIFIWAGNKLPDWEAQKI